jgi:hypothetical protein
MTDTKQIPQTLIDAFRAKNEAHDLVRISITRKQVKQNKISFEEKAEIYRNELFAFTGIDNQEFFNQTVDKLWKMV